MKGENRNRIKVERATAAKFSEEEPRASELTIEKMTATTAYLTVQAG